MKVRIGPHVNWVGPYQIAEAIVFWNKDLAYKFGEWLAFDKGGKDSRLSRILTKIHSWKKRNISVKIDNYDSWNADTTLAYIILPMLQEVKKNKHGSPFVDDSDVPLELHSTLFPAEEEWGTDGKFHERWEYVIDEMIWAFSAHIDDEAENQFYDHSECEGLDVLESIQKLKCDWVGLDKFNARKQNGFRLFGKYYMSLWT